MRLVEVIVLISTVLAVALLITVGFEHLVPSERVRPVAEFYLNATYNQYELRNYTAMSPEAVTAIVWDFRGLDTLFETSVFYLALIAGLALTRGLLLERAEKSGHGLSIIVRTVTRITAPMIVAVGASIGLHGHLTPGGGFQGGSVIAVLPMVVIVVFSASFLVIKGVTTTKLLVVRSLGLTGIGLTAIAVFLVGITLHMPAYVFQNMAKPDAQISMPYSVAGALISGTLWFFNIFEMFAVAAGFSIAFIALMLARTLESSRGE
ncbi:MAG: Na(+)/H(+) antiporter subunit B [Desulfurococcaceae archaeon]|nr:Na(+)/H(+) antiporter subunit B [Desulfurococcaceae archaeon]